MLKDFSAIGIFLIVAIAFPIITLAVSSLVRPNRPSPEKQTTYECGLDTQGETWVQFKSNYFMYALIFVAFDVETIFLYPWAVQFKSLGLFAFIEMIIFMTILIIGFWYAWKEGALEWM